MLIQEQIEYIQDEFNDRLENEYDGLKFVVYESKEYK